MVSQARQSRAIYSADRDVRAGRSLEAHPSAEQRAAIRAFVSGRFLLGFSWMLLSHPQEYIRHSRLTLYDADAAVR